MRAPKTLIASAAAAAIFSLIGVGYAETSVTGDPALLDESAHGDASADTGAPTVATSNVQATMAR